MASVIAIVESAPGAGRALEDAIGRRGIACVPVGHVEEHAAAPRLRALGTGAVLAADARAVPAAERLAEALGLPGNPACSTAVRADRYEMQQRLREGGLRHMEQIRTADVDRACSWAALHCGRGPVVLKPLASGTGRAIACSGRREVVAAFRLLHAAGGGALGAEVLVQQYAHGAAYALDVVACDGGMRVAAVWQCGAQPALLPNGGALQEALLAYARQVLQALEIRHGPARLDLIWPAGADAPVLVDAVACVHGADQAALHEQACGRSHLGLALDACTGARRPGDIPIQESTAWSDARSRSAYLPPPEPWASASSRGWSAIPGSR